MEKTSSMATTKMSMASFAIIAILGMVVEYAVNYASNFVHGLFGIFFIYAAIVIILFGVGFFGFKKNPDNDLLCGLKPAVSHHAASVI